VAALLDRVRAARATPARPANLSFQEWVDWFNYDGVNYPLLRTTMGKLDEEQLVQTATAAYHGNGPVFALVVARLQVFSQARFQWTRFEGGKPGDLFGSPELKVLERPWAGGTTADLLARMEVDVSLAGNCYVRRITRPRQPARLLRLRPEWVIVALGSDEDADHPGQAGDVEVLGYAYAPPGGPIIPLSTAEVAHFAPLPDPDFNFLGMSWITPLLRDVQADGAMTEHKRRFLVNAATPNLVIKFDANISQENVEKFKAIFEAGHMGTENAYRTVFLGGGADAVTVGKDFQQLDFAAVQGRGESRLAAAAGVPPSWVGFSEGLQGSSLNAGNFNSSRRRFADGTAQHWWVNAASSLETIIQPPQPSDGGASLWFDTRSVSFMREDAADLAKIQAEEAGTIVALVKDGFTAKSAVDAVVNHDWARLQHSGLTSVQLQPPFDGQGAAAMEQTRALVEMVQKVYLGVDVVLSAEEAREILNRAGAGLSAGGLPGISTPPPNGQGNGKVPAALAR
jgi:phage portal protein BeeE